MKILIPTSGIGSRLGNLTKYTNKALIKIGDKAAISHIIDLYPSEEFVITLGYYGDHVRQYLEMAYPHGRFTFVNVDPFEGPGSGLLKSISFAKEHLQEPFIFHVCDTILDRRPPDPGCNWMACGLTSSPDLYRTVISNKDRIVKINEKGEINYDYAYTGVAGINDYKKFWKELDNVVNTPDSSDCHILQKMLASSPVYLHVDVWIDTGNVNGLNYAKGLHKSRFEVLDKYEESIYFINDDVIKFFADDKIVKGRVERANYLEGLVPSIKEHSENFYKYELMPGTALSEVVTDDKLERLINWAEENLWKPVDINRIEFLMASNDFYLNKTNSRLNKYFELTDTEDSVDDINGLQVPPLEEVFNKIDWPDLWSTQPTLFHGDFVLDNILINDDQFTLLDWRQDFGGILEAGDIYYDLAKLNHNLIFNHEIINKGGYHLTINDGLIFCDLERSHNKVIYQQNLLKLLDKKGYDIQKIQLLSAIIWLNMAPLHIYPLNKFLFYFGKYNLWKLLYQTN